MSKAEKSNLGKQILLALSITFVILMTYLGFWQLDRAEQKEQILKQWYGSAVEFKNGEFHRATQHTMAADKHKLFYRKVLIKGTFDSERYFLLDNRTRNAKVGYEVIAVMTPSLSEHQKAQVVFVNLGWIAAPSDRQILPRVDLPVDEIEITGWLKKVNAGLVLAEDKWLVNWPVRIQQAKLTKMATTLGADDHYPLLLLAEQPLSSQFITQWQPTNMTVEKHLGYAAQWFLMAIVLVLMILWFFVSSHRESKGGSQDAELLVKGEVDETASS